MSINGDPTTSIGLAKPAGGVVGQSMYVVAIAISFQPSKGTAVNPAGNVPVITPPAGWTTVLADAPAGENAMGNLGSGAEADRLAIYTKPVEVGDPIGWLWSWIPSGNAGNMAFIQIFDGAVGTPPTVDAAAAAITVSVAGGNPIATVAPSVVTTLPDDLMLAIYMARSSDASLFAAPPGMLDPNWAGGVVNNPLGDLANITSSPAGLPFTLAMFTEQIVAPGATGTRTTPITQNAGQQLRSAGYSLALGVAGGGGGSTGPLEIYARFH